MDRSWRLETLNAGRKAAHIYRFKREFPARSADVFAIESRNSVRIDVRDLAMTGLHHGQFGTGRHFINYVRRDTMGFTDD